MKQLTKLTVIAFVLAMPFLSKANESMNQTSGQTSAIPMPEIKEGNIAPGFTLKNIEGEEVTLNSLRGKWVMLDFWGAWCKWCIVGIPQMKENYDKFKEQCYFVSIDCRDSYEEWTEAVKKYGLDWIQLQNAENGGISVTDLYRVKGYPTKILIDPEGVIKDVCIGEDPTFYDRMAEMIGSK